MPRAISAATSGMSAKSASEAIAAYLHFLAIFYRR